MSPTPNVDASVTGSNLATSPCGTTGYNASPWTRNSTDSPGRNACTSTCSRARKGSDVFGMKGVCGGADPAGVMAGLARTRGRLYWSRGVRDRRDKSIVRPGPTAAGAVPVAGSRTALGAGRRMGSASSTRTSDEDASESTSVGVGDGDVEASRAAPFSLNSRRTILHISPHGSGLRGAPSGLISIRDADSMNISKY